MSSKAQLKYYFGSRKAFIAGSAFMYEDRSS